MKKHERFIAEHPEVEAWLRNRPEPTRRKFASGLLRFSKAVGISPEDWRRLDKFEARDLAWRYVQPKIAEHPGVALDDLICLKSWYRNHNGEQLPFDSRKGGKHYIRKRHTRRAREHVPSKREIYEIVDMSSSLRDKALLLFLFQSGVRVNVLEHISYGHVKDQLGYDIITLKVTGDLDYKLRSMDVPFYYTFLNGEASETLRRYCEVEHKESNADTPLFRTKGGKPVTQRWIWKVVKMCVERAGLDPATVWTHTLRRAFRKVLFQSDVPEEFKEMVMGHVLRGSREDYFDRYNLSYFTELYKKCSFGREAPGSETAKLADRIRELEKQNAELRQRLNSHVLSGDQVAELLHRIEKLEKQAQE
jgi:site-specific recombinase XerC